MATGIEILNTIKGTHPIHAKVLLIQMLVSLHLHYSSTLLKNKLIQNDHYSRVTGEGAHYMVQLLQIKLIIPVETW